MTSIHTQPLVVDFTGDASAASALATEIIGCTQPRVVLPTGLLEDLTRRRGRPAVSELIVVGAPPTSAVGYGLVPLLAAALRPKTVTLLDTRSRIARSTSLGRYMVLSAPLSCCQLLGSALALAAQSGLARVKLNRGSAPPKKRELRRLLYLRPLVGMPVRVGGSVTHAHGFLSGLRRLDVDVEAFTTDPAIAETAAEMAFPGWNVVSIPGLTKSIPASAAVGGDVALTAATWRVVRDCDVVYQRHTRFSLAGALIARRAELPLFLEYNSPAEFFHPRATLLAGRRALCEATALSSAARVFVVSNVAKTLLIERGLPAERIIVNPNGVDLELFGRGDKSTLTRHELGFSERDIVFGFVGSFIEFHGVAVLAEAFVELSSVFPSARLLLVGDGDEAPRVQQILADVGRGSVVMTGRVHPHEVPSYLEACDVLVSPHVPLRDGMPFFGSPTKLFEYMAAGKAIVASRLGQIGEVLEDGVTALLVQPGDRAALVAAMQRLVRDRDLRSHLGETARIVGRRYSWTANAQRVVDAYRDLAEDT
jgi:glycosyltransferase involved in cell wall biosynthesis